jgi:hypothetical protein
MDLTLFFLGMASSRNGNNVLQRSPIFSSLVEGNTFVVHYKISKHAYDKLHFHIRGLIQINQTNTFSVQNRSNC